MPAALADPGEWGTEQHPLLMSGFGFDHLHVFLQERMRHVHTVSGRCIRNIYGPPCRDVLPLVMPDWGQECAVAACSRLAVQPNDVDDWVCGAHR